MVQFNNLLQRLPWAVVTFVYLIAVNKVYGFPVAQRHGRNLGGTTTEQNSKLHQSDGSSWNATIATQMVLSKTTPMGNLAKEEQIRESVFRPINSSTTLEQHLKDEHSSESVPTDFLYKQKSVEGADNTSLGNQNTSSDLRNTEYSGNEESTVLDSTTLSTTSNMKLEDTLPIQIHRGLQDLLKDLVDESRKMVDTSLGSTDSRKNNNNSNNNNKRSIPYGATKADTSQHQVKVFASMFWLAFSFTRGFSTFRRPRPNIDTTPEVQASLEKDITKVMKNVNLAETTTQNTNNVSDTTLASTSRDVKFINCTVDDDDCGIGSVQNTVHLVPRAAHKRAKNGGQNGQLVPSETLLDFLNALEGLQINVNSTLDIICSNLTADLFPSGVPDCRSYAELKGSSILPCNGSVTTTTMNEKATASETVILSMKAISDHYQLLQTVSELHDRLYQNKIHCYDIVFYSIDHIRCNQGVAMTKLRSLQELGIEILTDMGVDEVPGPSTLLCEVDMSIEKKFSLGPLWRVQHDLGEVYSNIKAALGNGLS